MKRTKNNKGITLIALVVTIIVLLILAGVTIATLMGDNGILTRANNASVAQIEGQVDEEIKLAVQSAKMYAEEMATRTSTGWLASKKIDSVVEVMEIDLTEEKGYTVEAGTGKIIVTYETDAYKKATNNSDAKIVKEITVVNNTFTIGEGETPVDPEEPLDEVENFTEYILFGTIENGIILEDGELSIYLNEDRYDIMTRYAFKYCEPICQDYFLKTKKVDMGWNDDITFTNAVDDLYAKGLINAKYETVQDLMILGYGQTESDYMAFCDEALEDVGLGMSVEMYDPNGEEFGGGSIEVPVEIGEYEYKVTVNEKEYKFKISIDQYEVVSDGVNAYCVDVVNKKCLLFNDGKVIVDETENVIDNGKIDSPDGLYTYIDIDYAGFSGINKIILQCEQMNVEGYINFTLVS